MSMSSTDNETKTQRSRDKQKREGGTWAKKLAFKVVFCFTQHSHNSLLLLKLQSLGSNCVQHKRMLLRNQINWVPQYALVYGQSVSYSIESNWLLHMLCLPKSIGSSGLVLHHIILWGRLKDLVRVLENINERESHSFFVTFYHKEISHHFCHILLITSTSLGLACLQEKGII